METTNYSDGQPVQVQVNGTWTVGTVVAVTPATVRVDVDGTTVTVRSDARIMPDTPDTPDQVATATTTATADDGYPVDADAIADRSWGHVDRDRWSIMLDDDGRQMWGRAGRADVVTYAPTDYAPNGLPLAISARTPGVQGNRVLRADVDGGRMVCGSGVQVQAHDMNGAPMIDADGAPIMIDRGCGQETSVTKFPTDGIYRLDIHRPCNSNALAVRGSIRVRPNMAN